MNYQVDLKLIQNKRKLVGYTYQQMADKLSLSGKSQYYKRENGDTKFKSSEIPLLCQILGIDMEKIFVKSLIKSQRKVI
ncbi:helix-turn-helix domain-containing protein [Levilactobacillus bambusae]|uniref:Transcriptional regulator n=1 Tax=Levilactobacillus bambusae TaxID=2024736 RepID=A0A2V1N189_9LACO|nr:helix-turn-helix transcriptional regulator [Levilactobacillus bambusae]PWG00984.1 transcriptional regulator [Levilactobacillus bambusae]